jgi:pilus assembly protein Flp/PilA
MKNQITKFLKEEKGQGMTEYGLILGAVVLVGVAVFTDLGEAIKNKFTAIATSLK